MSHNVKLQVDFDQLCISDGVVELLANNLKDETAKEGLAMVQRGKKLQLGPANHLIICLLRSLSLADIFDDETFQGESHATNEANESSGETEDKSDSELNLDREIENDESLTQMLKEARKKETAGRSKSDKGVGQKRQEKQEKYPKHGKKELTPKTSAKRDEVCRFYLNGKCRYKGDCRFEHPKICPKFRQDGDCEVKGCGGGCEFLHPNVCHSSLRDKTCTYQECKFFHLKGTKTVERVSKHGNSNNPSWRTDQGNSKLASKNGQPSLSQRTRKKGTNPKQNQKQNKREETTSQTVTQEEKLQLGQTLEAIMKRLDAMESRPTYYPHPGAQIQQRQPLLSPAVPQPGTQTQYRWGSPIPWTQTQTQT